MLLRALLIIAALQVDADADDHLTLTQEAFLLGQLTAQETWDVVCNGHVAGRSHGAMCDPQDRPNQVKRLERLRVAHWMRLGPEPLWREVDRGRMTAPFARAMHCHCFTPEKACDP